MIAIFTTNRKLAGDLEARIVASGVTVAILEAEAVESIELLYAPYYRAVVVDSVHPFLAEAIWSDMLRSLAKKLPVFLLDQSAESPAQLLSANHADHILQLIAQHHSRILKTNEIPMIVPAVLADQLVTQGLLTVLAIDVSGFRSIAIEYGNEAYQKVSDVFNKLLIDLQGRTGSFRFTDQVVRGQEKSHLFYIVLGSARGNRKMPAPGVTERLAEKIYVQMYNAFWSEIQKKPADKDLPDCVAAVPDFCVGFATSLYNPSIDAKDSVEHLLTRAVNAAPAQRLRLRARLREVIYNIIHTTDLLVPHFQAVFQLQGLTLDHLNTVKKEQSMTALRPFLFGFEALARVNKTIYNEVYDNGSPIYLEADLLRPDAMFTIAQDVKLALELDQACLQAAGAQGKGLPGELLLNILPRNLYNLDKLAVLKNSREKLIFEVSETEAVDNLELMVKVRERIERMDIKIAADDFGRGYSGLEQLLRIRPHMIKLDRSLIENIHQDQSKQAFVSGLVKAAKLAQTVVLAEGVEVWEEARWLQSIGVDLVQGFLLHRPASVADITEKFALNVTAKHHNAA